MDKIISNDEIKTILGISGTSQDALIEIWNTIATGMLLSTLNIENLTTHTITDEEVTLYNPEHIILEAFPVDTNEPITLKDGLKNEITGYTFELVSNVAKRTLRVLNDSGIPSSLGDPAWRGYPNNIFVSYTAGYTVQDTLEVLSLTSLANTTITVTTLGVSTTYTFKSVGPYGDEDIPISIDTDSTATSIVSVIGGTASGSVVTLPLGSKVTLGTATAAQLTITNATMPEALKNAVAYMVGGGIAEKSKIGGRVEYTIGGKTVKFGGKTQAEAAANGQSVLSAFDYWIPLFKKIAISAV